MNTERIVLGDVNRAVSDIDKEIKDIRIKMKWTPIMRATKIEEFQNIKSILLVVQRKMTPTNEGF